MEVQSPSWALPNAAWQAVVRHMHLDDLLSARRACKLWREDLGAFVTTATAIPAELLGADCSAERFSTESRVQSWLRQADTALSNPGFESLKRSAPEEALPDRRSPQCRRSPAAAVRVVLDAFPHCETLLLDISTQQDQELVCGIMNAVAGTTANGSKRSSLESCSRASLNDSSSCESKSEVSDDSKTPGCSGRPLQDRWRYRYQIQLDAMQRSYHCLARQEYPCRPSDTGALLFNKLSSLPRQLSPSGLFSLHTVQLDVFPQQPQGWLALRELPGLRTLLLPGFKPAVPHQHLSALAQITQLTTATLSVQGSFTSWRANCDAFVSLSSLNRLTSLTLHAFHCPGPQLAAALGHMSDLAQLRLSGRVVLEPLLTLHHLTKLDVLELTQDVQSSVLCDLVQHLPGVTQLAIGRVNFPPAAAAPPPAAAAPPPAADLAGPAPAADNPGPAVAAPAAAEAAAVVVAADVGGNGAAVAAAAADGENDVMLEDVGAIVDGLIGNLQEGNVPVHLQRIIERFESIIQLDLTRSSASSPWAWPVLGSSMLEQLGSNTYSGSTAGSKCRSRSHQQPCSSCQHSDASHSNPDSRATACSSLELALLRPSDVMRLDELPCQLCCCRHLGLRLRDQLLAFASVCPVRLAHGQLSSLGNTFRCLQSLSICGKVALDGTTLCQVAQGLGDTGGDIAAGSSAQKAHGLLALSLDCHFVSVPPEQMAEAMQHLKGLKVLSLRHRGQGKLPIPITALPTTLTSLAVKKVLLYQSQQQTLASSAVVSRNDSLSSRAQSPALGCQVLAAESSHVGCHAITSPGFKRAVAAGTLSRAPSADLASLGLGETATSALSSDSSNDGNAPAAAQNQSIAEQLPLLPNLQSLLLKNCLICTGAIHKLLDVPADTVGDASSSSVGAACLGSRQLTKLCITGDNSSHTEVVEGWSTWLEVFKQLKGLQVLDLTVPESLGCSLPDDLLDVLLTLPRLAHLHLTTSHQPQQLLGLTGLQGLRTLSLHYSGPPALPSYLLGELQAGLGLYCKVRLWEMLVLQHVNSFGGASSGGGAADGPDAERLGNKRGVVKKLAGVVGWTAVAVGGWWCGWVLGGAIEHKRGRRKSRKT